MENKQRIDNKYKSILIKNGFVRDNELQWWIRHDWVMVQKYKVSYWDWETFKTDSIYTTIGWLAIQWDIIIYC